MAKKNESKVAHTGYGEASAAECKEIFEMARQAGMPVMLVGDPGVGKTAMINDYAISHGLGEPWCLIGSTLEPQDMAGLPHAANDAATGVEYTEYLIPPWQKAIMGGKTKVLFLDEFSNSPAAIQAAQLKLIGERRFANGDKIPDDVFIVMAMNPESSAVDYTPIAAPMANRICFLSYKPTPQEVYEGLTGGWYSDEVQATWTESEKKWRVRVVEFLKKNSAYILQMNKIADGDLDSSAPAWMHPESENSESEREILCSTWPSPRSWDNACHMLGKGSFDKEITPLQERILAGIVGRPATVYLTDYVHAHAQIDAFALIADPSLQDWVVSDADGASYNDILELAQAVVTKIPQCDGKNGRPNPEQALDFFSKVIDLGGGAHFAPHYCLKGEVRDFFKKNRPDYISQNEWSRRINTILIKYKENDYIS